ncbi:short-chain dehydrogenase/reductase SDR [Calocera cornea HHB12733]|uniref:Short-chain dehydrogenase/reductase SDR n=1 Tax=Calocera cornea HHB12733 TaxID=1353952 RepID=A0A165DWW4_9BASI|nr:short-chain dehydrogenase/reductase SDR [Calocera cornea HHB12733]
MPTPPEDLPVTHHHDIYPGIAPSRFAGSLKGKVVFITGASRGIGEATAVAFAQSGASLFLASRKRATLDGVKDSILKAVSDTKVGTRVTDVVDHKSVRAAIEACVKEFGRLDVVVSNAGTMENFGQSTYTAMAEHDPDGWWQIWEVNVKGSFNVAHYALPELGKTKGYFIFLSSIGAQRRDHGASSYPTGKHAVNRIAEFAAIETPGVKVFAVHPGAVKTELSKAGGPWLAKILIDDVQLPAWTMVRLVQGTDDYLSGRYVSVNWDLDEVHDQWKEAIVEEDALKNRLALPSAAHKA